MSTSLLPRYSRWKPRQLVGDFAMWNAGTAGQDGLHAFRGKSENDVDILNYVRRNRSGGRGTGRCATR